MTYNVKNVIKDTLTGNLQVVPEEVAKKRIALCQICSHRRENIPNQEVKHERSKAVTPWRIEKDKCNLCGCYMPVKVKLAKATCPLKKW